MPIPSGGHLGPYENLVLLGAGGMGEVYRAHDTRLDRDVALKLLHPDAVEDPDARGRLMREARTASALNHPHICTMYDVKEIDGLTFVVMEYVDGETLRARVAGGPLRPAAVIRYGCQLADALAHAHDRGVIHRDLTSGNVMITRDGRAKVLDFGLASRLIDEPSDFVTQSVDVLAASGSVAGTLPYMAPEQLRGETPDRRTDIWAIGVLLYEALAGRRPFEGDSPYALGASILEKEPAPLPADVAPSIRAVVARCLEKSPSERYQRASEVRAALEVITSDAAAAPAGPKSQPLSLHGSVPVARRRLSAILAVVAAAITVTTVIWIGAGADRAAPVPGTAIKSLAVLPLRNLTGDPSQEWLTDGMTDALSSTFARLGSLTVVSTTSTLGYRNTTRPLREIAIELGDIDALVEGSVSRDAGRVRVSLSVVHARTDRRLWGGTYDRDFADVLAMYSDVALAASRDLSIAMTSTERAGLQVAYTPSADAYEAYLRAVHLRNRSQDGGCIPAERHLLRAIAIDPRYAAPHALLASCYVFPDRVGRPSSEALSRARSAADQAIALDPSLGSAYIARGYLEMRLDYDQRAAERSFRRALELDPGDAQAHAAWGPFLAVTGRPDEGLASIRRALRLSPLGLDTNVAVGHLLLRLGRYAPAIEDLKRTLELDGRYNTAWYWLADAYAGAGEQAPAVDAYLRWLDLVAVPERAGTLRANLQAVYSTAGWTAFWERELELADQEARRPGSLYQRPHHRYSGPTFIARRAARLKQWDRALTALEAGLEEHHYHMPFIGIDPVFAPIRTHPRFVALMRRMGLPIPST